MTYLVEITEVYLDMESIERVMLLNTSRQPSARKKVIEKLKDQYNYSRKVRNKNNNVYFEYWDGRTDSYKDAIEIVEKGGIE